MQSIGDIGGRDARASRKLATPTIVKPYSKCVSALTEEVLMATYQRESGMGCLLAALLALVIIFVPVIGHIILTVMILADDLSSGEKVLWLVVVWLFWFIGPFLYLLVGQRRNRLLDARRI
jgi:hypothetical protein